MGRQPSVIPFRPDPNERKRTFVGLSADQGQEQPVPGMSAGSGRGSCPIGIEPLCLISPVVSNDITVTINRFGAPPGGDRRRCERGRAGCPKPNPGEKRNEILLVSACRCPRHGVGNGCRPGADQQTGDRAPLYHRLRHVGRPDKSRWTPGIDVKRLDMVGNCCLIRHVRGLMLRNTGVSDDVASTPMVGRGRAAQPQAVA